MEELISIILPVYNGEKFLKASIESCLIQTYANFELIIVDDCSTDGSNDIAREYAARDKRIKLFRNSKNIKLPASLNVGHEAALGKYITWTSDDNLFHKDALSIMHKSIIAKNTDVVYSNYLHIDEAGNLTGNTLLKPIEYLVYDNVIGPCFLYKNEVFKKNNGYKPEHFLVEDYEFWLKAAINFSFYKIDNPGLYYYRLHGESLSGKMDVDHELKVSFGKNKSRIFKSIFSTLDLSNRDLIVDYFTSRFNEDRFDGTFPFSQRNFMKDIRKVSEHFHAFYQGKLEKIVLEDAVENILLKRAWQKPSILYRLHIEAGSEILNLSIRRYLALIKKCILN